MATEQPIKIEFDLSKFTAGCEAAVRDELPFAWALALTGIAGSVRKGVRDDMPSHFTLRNTFVSRNISVDPQRVPKGEMEVSIGSRQNKGNNLMELEAIGGVGHGKRGKGVWVPTDAARPSKQALIPRSNKPTAILRGKSFLTLKSGERLNGQGMFFAVMPNGGHGIFHREAGTDDVSHFWSFQNAVKIPEIWPFLATVQKTLGDKWPDVAKRALERALKSRK